MKNPPIKLHWIERCIEVHHFHIQQLKDENNWTIEKTAKSLNRSIGSVSQDLLLASWFRSHEKQLRRFTCMKDALEFVREKKKEIQLAEVDY
jgi:hypothetical protein